MENTNKLPENWVIDTEKEKDSPLMPKFMEWYNINSTTVSMTNYEYLGCYLNEISDWNNSKNTIPVITLEQWHEAYFPEWQPKQGERVLVSNFSHGEYRERIFVVQHNEFYFVENEEDAGVLLGWPYIKSLPKQSQLQPRIDQLKNEAEKLGLKIEIIIS